MHLHPENRGTQSHSSLDTNFCHLPIVTHFCFPLYPHPPVVSSCRNIQATDQLWGIIEFQNDKASADASAAAAAIPSVGGSEDANMTDASAAARSTAAPLVAPALVPLPPPETAANSAAAAAAAAADPSSGGRDREKEPRAVAEKAVLALLSVLEQLSSATNISSSPSVRDLDWVCHLHLLIHNLPYSSVSDVCKIGKSVRVCDMPSLAS